MFQLIFNHQITYLCQCHCPHFASKPSEYFCAVFPSSSSPCSTRWVACPGGASPSSQCSAAPSWSPPRSADCSNGRSWTERPADSSHRCRWGRASPLWSACSSSVSEWSLWMLFSAFGSCCWLEPPVGALFRYCTICGSPDLK